jgi:hypothetical protein
MKAMNKNLGPDFATEQEGRLDLQLSDLLEVVLRLERRWRQEERLDAAIKYTR